MAYGDILDELVAIIKATWNDVLDAQIYTLEESLRRNLLEDHLNGKISLPIVVIDMFGFPSDPTSPVGTDGRRMPLVIHYVTTQKTIGNGSGPSKFTLNQIAALQQAIDYLPHHTNFFVKEFGNISSAATTAANANIGVDSKVELWIGSLTYVPGLVTGVGGY